MGWEEKGSSQSRPRVRGGLRHYWLVLALSFLHFLLPFLATIKPPNVTCIPKVRSIQMIVHPTTTPIHTGDGHRLTLEDVFPDLSYHLELQVNHTYQMVSVYVSLVLPCLGNSFPSQLDLHRFK